VTSRRAVSAFVTLAAALLLAATGARGRAAIGPHPLPLAHATYTTLDYPGAYQTAAWGVNRTGFMQRTIEVVGVFSVHEGTYGFLYSNGHYTRIDVPDSYDTYPFAINGHGEVVGTYIGKGGAICPFSWTNGVYARQNLAGDHCMAGGDYQTFGIDNAGTVVGVYDNPAAAAFEGFVQTATGRFTTVKSSELYGIADNAQLVGLTIDASGNYHGMRYSSPTASGIPFDVPGAADTVPHGINSAGVITGAYGPFHGVGYPDETYPGEQGFIDANGTFTRLDYPGATATGANGINDAVAAITAGPGSGAGFDVVGLYQAANGAVHGFLATIGPKSAGNA